jgi:hypothetical protein
VSIKTGDDGLANLRDEVVVAGKLVIRSGGDANVLSGFAGLPDFSAPTFDHSLDIDNPYFPIVPGTVYNYHTQGVDPDTGESFTENNIVEVTNETRVLAGVTVRRVHDTVFRSDGKIKEDTFDHYAQDNNGNVWYFGEDVINYEYDDNGNLLETTDEGSWLAGLDNAQAGIIMEATPRVGTRYYQEFAPANDVLDTGVGLSVNDQVTVTAGHFSNLYRTEETTVIEPNALANKLYAPGLGTVIEYEYDQTNNDVIETVELLSVTLNGTPVTQVVDPAGFQGTNSTFSRVIGEAKIGGRSNIATSGALVANRAIFNDTLGIRSLAESVLIDSELKQKAAISSREPVALRGIAADGKLGIGGGERSVRPGFADQRIASPLRQRR